MKGIGFKVGALACGLLFSTAALAQTDIIAQLFDKATEIYKGKGYSPTGWQQRGELKQGASIRYPIKLTGGKQYSIVGMCDTDCSNADAVLYDANGNKVDSDVEADDFPIVAASASGNYTIELTMVACSSAPCAYGVKSFVQP